MPHTKEQYEEALRLLQSTLPYAIQKRDRSTGEWKTIGNVIRGRNEAFTAMSELQRQNKHSEYRVLPKNEADKYREGLAIGLAIGRRLGAEETQQEMSEDKNEVKLPLMYMPEHL